MNLPASARTYLAGEKTYDKSAPRMNPQNNPTRSQSKRFLITVDRDER
jgi:hypothetical protein